MSLRFFLKELLCALKIKILSPFFSCVSVRVCLCIWICAHVCVGALCAQRPHVFFSLPQLFLPVIQWCRVSTSKPELVDLASLTSCLAGGILSPLPSLGLQTSSYVCPHLHPYLYELCGSEPRYLSGQCFNCLAISTGLIRPFEVPFSL